MSPTSSHRTTFVCCSSSSVRTLLSVACSTGSSASNTSASASARTRIISRRAALLSAATSAIAICAGAATCASATAAESEQCPVLDASVTEADSIDPSMSPPAVTDSVELWIRAGSQAPKRVLVELYGCVVPETVSNFLQLVRKGAYDQTSVYRIVPQLTVQMGDVLHNGGSSGRSAAEDGLALPPENYIVRHTCPGIVSMARDIEGRVDSRFFVATRPGDSAYLDDRYVAFGSVTKDGLDVLYELERFVGPANTPRVSVFIERAIIVE